MYGFKRNLDGQITGEIDTLRYSALDSWLKSKDGYRKRYYEGQSFQTPETVFGHKIHQAIEKGEIVLPGLPRHRRSEYNIEVSVGTKKSPVKIGGCIDSFDPETLAFLDYKCSHLSKDGKAPWSAVKVAKHMQLVFYSLLIKAKHKKVAPVATLIWIGTEFKQKAVEFAGHTLVADSRELSLTGNWHAFPRRIAQWERDHLLEIILRSAKEIEEDFTKYKEANG